MKNKKYLVLKRIESKNDPDLAKFAKLGQWKSTGHFLEQLDIGDDIVSYWLPMPKDNGEEIIILTNGIPEWADKEIISPILAIVGGKVFKQKTEVWVAEANGTLWAYMDMEKYEEVFC